MVQSWLIFPKNGGWSPRQKAAAKALDEMQGQILPWRRRCAENFNFQWITVSPFSP
jgi:hypothetical protein